MTISLIDELARDVTRLESLRAVKDVQRRYAHYQQYGRWTEMAALFAGDATLDWGGAVIAGRSAIGAWLSAREGSAADGDGLAPGALHAELIDEPLVNLSPDGRTAQARWMSHAFRGDGAGRAWFEGGIYENDYAIDGAGATITAVRYFPLLAGDYADGWTNAGGGDLARFPFHFTADEAGIPIPPADRPAPSAVTTVTALAPRIAALNDEDDVRNLQHALGYYIDRRMWEDVVDLFAEDCTVDLDGQLARGRDGVRTALETTMGPAGLAHGILNEHPQFDTMVRVAPGGREARSRGIELALLGAADEGTAGWQINVFGNRFVKQDGLWLLADLRVVRLMAADYATGWGAGALLGRAAAPVVDFLDGSPIAEPGSPDSAEPAESAASDPVDAVDLAEAQRRYRRSLAYDGAENVSSAYGYFIDDFQWPQMADIMAVNGNKQSPFAGYYLGRERIRGAATAMWGEPPPLRAAISFHWRTQPVIHVSPDGRSANVRTRLFQPRTAKDPSVTPHNFYMGGFHGGMYPNDQVVLEDGIWRLWSLTIDEHYFYMPSWADGWSGATDPDPDDAPRVSPLLTRYPPDILITELGRREEGFRGGTGTPIDWPGILPMWFHYRNPVSGREPEHFWPDCVPSELRPESSMTRHGYQLPSSGPARR